jgi:hypothetical protein
METGNESVAEHALPSQQKIEEEQKEKLLQNEPDSVFSCDDAIERIGFGRFQLMLLFLAGICWMADATEVYFLVLTLEDVTPIVYRTDGCMRVEFKSK